jgi:hypothetical protein
MRITGPVVGLVEGMIPGLGASVAYRLLSSSKFDQLDLPPGGTGWTFNGVSAVYFREHVHEQEGHRAIRASQRSIAADLFR